MLLSIRLSLRIAASGHSVQSLTCNSAWEEGVYGHRAEERFRMSNSWQSRGLGLTGPKSGDVKQALRMGLGMHIDASERTTRRSAVCYDLLAQDVDGMPDMPHARY